MDTLVKWGGLLVALLGAIWGIYARGRTAGRKHEQEKLRKETGAIQEKWDAIDRDDVDFERALDGLQARDGDRR